MSALFQSGKKATSYSKSLLSSGELSCHELTEPEAAPAVWGSAKEPDGAVQNNPSRLVLGDC